MVEGLTGGKHRLTNTQGWVHLGGSASSSNGGGSGGSGGSGGEQSPLLRSQYKQMYDRPR